MHSVIASAIDCRPIHGFSQSFTPPQCKATVGFEKLGASTGAPPKSLIRMFGPRGNPQAKNLFSVIGYLSDVLEHMSNGHPMNRLDDLLPWKWTPSTEAAA